MAAVGLDGNNAEGAANTDCHHSYLLPEIEAILREASPSSEITVVQGSTENEGEKRKAAMEVNFVHEPTMTGSRNSDMEKTCAACAMKWSIELEKGLRSSAPGVPVQAILQLGPRLMKWSIELESDVPSNTTTGLVPGEVKLFANAILLRLVNAFKEGNTEIKLSVLKVFLFERKHRDVRKHRQCKGLLSEVRVANNLELLKQVKYVYDNGDLKSKVLALVLLGCWADFTHDNAQIRYILFSSLVSPHDLQVRASLFAAGCFCELSDDFASITLLMLSNMMDSSTVSLPVKLAVAQVFPKFKCTFPAANKAHVAGQQLVMNSSDEDFVVAMLFSLTELSSISTLLASFQVDFLLKFLKRETISSREQEAALSCLKFLSNKGLCKYPAEQLSSIEKRRPKSSMATSSTIQVQGGQTLEQDLESHYESWAQMIKFQN